MRAGAPLLRSPATGAALALVAAAFAVAAFAGGSFALRKSDVIDGPGVGKDGFNFSGSFPVRGRAFDPRPLAVEIRYGDPSAPSRVTIPADDPGWRGGGGKWRWKSPQYGSPTRYAVSVDAVHGRFDVKGHMLAIATSPGPGFVTGLDVGGESFAETQPHADRRFGRFRYRAL